MTLCRLIGFYERLFRFPFSVVLFCSSVCPVIRVILWYSVVVLWWGFIGFSYRFMFINCSI